MTKRKGLSEQWLQAMATTEIIKPPKKEEIVIWLDDIRDPAKYGYPNAVWYKSAQEWLVEISFLDRLDKLDLVTEIHFDNDLGDDHPWDGYKLFTFIEEDLLDGKYKGLKKIYVHSSNPSAVHKFMLAARSFKHHFGIDIIRQQC